MPPKRRMTFPPIKLTAAAPRLTVLHIQPGDALLIGNVGSTALEHLDEIAAQLRETVSVEAPVFFFAGDIDVTVLRNHGCSYISNTTPGEDACPSAPASASKATPPGP